MELINILKALSDETRLRILNLLKYGELCVCEIEKLLNLTQSNASRHLMVLNKSGIITRTKRQQYVYYSLNEITIKKYSILKSIFEDMENVQTLKEEYQRLLKFKEEGKGCHNLD
ncbi:ArsR family transcriptional regulator [Caloramator fervidus]|mgnify:CR=1 FL=1|uniref:ArsR family transcriptional regulator n=1 Tax=Caloramator fervidus TaxID=29344 RepID=A0A1H5TPS6_9CLOT|nr:metalloregulator ArsR/SmtB family transcription factor [Caloramator fervidus]SEF64804.1 ArsR family transcriptional regulator [Caloramator fervidus]